MANEGKLSHEEVIDRFFPSQAITYFLKTRDSLGGYIVVHDPTFPLASLESCDEI